MAVPVATEERLVPTPLGDARLLAALPDRPRAVLVLGHGAGGGVAAPDLVTLAGALPGLARAGVVRVEQPWRVAGRRVAPAPAVLDRGWLAAWERLGDVLAAVAGAVDAPRVAGGRSAGARVACRTAAGLGAAGVLALAFPLHPPGRPERSRLAELAGCGVPALVVQGERDPFGGPHAFPAGAHEMVAVPGADHSFRVPRGAAPGPRETLDGMAAAVAGWLDRLLRPAWTAGE